VTLVGVKRRTQKPDVCSFSRSCTDRDAFFRTWICCDRWPAENAHHGRIQFRADTTSSGQCPRTVPFRVAGMLR